MVDLWSSQKTLVVFREHMEISSFLNLECTMRCVKTTQRSQMSVACLLGLVCLLVFVSVTHQIISQTSRGVVTFSVFV